MKEYYIVKIVDEKTIIINAGFKDGVNIGDKFEIYDNDNEIIDPFTKKSLGAIPLIKETVTVEKIFEKMAICKCIVNNGVLNTTSNALAQLIGSEYKTLNIDKEDITGGLLSSSKIRVGDKVKKKVMIPIANKKH